MTEKALIDEYWRYIRDCKPQKMEEFKAYTKGTGPWPEGIVSSRHRPVYERSNFPEDIELELGGKNDALALHILKAVVLSMPKESIPYHEAGIRVLHSLGVPFEDVYCGIEESPTMDPWTIYKYYPDETKAFLEAQISKIGPNKKLYAPNMAIAAELAVEDPAKYKSFIPLIEGFVENQLAEWDKDSEKAYWFSQRCARRAAVVAGDLSPALQKFRRCIFFDMSFPENPYTMDELWEIGKKIGIADEWFEILLLQGSMNETKLKDLPKSPAELAEHLRKFYKENPALFEKTYRAFYWQLDGKKITDDIPHPEGNLRASRSAEDPPKKSFIYSLYLLSIKIENGEGQKEMAELAKNWDKLIEIRDNDFLGQTPGDYDYTRPFAAVYESGIPQLDAAFDKAFAKLRSRSDDTSDRFSLGLRILMDLRGQWCNAESTAKAFADTARISVEDFHNAFNTVKHAQRHAGGGSVPFGPFPSELIREYTRLHQDETRAYIENNLAIIGAKPVRQEYRAEDFPNWVKAVFTSEPSGKGDGSGESAGLPITDALILFGAKSKRVFQVLEELLVNREDEIRTELEKRLPKYKKDASETAQRLIARWNAKKAAVK
ncbi:hypothetical protein [Leadbettera azotonutricia]|uniref:Uncharacterized protein n=1 Tax=Leadbettera azotonutricia (strain ATCC BAA-888 / DSM 13862 / ZAS-9) TaxID=545695 RepID=F5Y9N3_LEAAZ|nr:hypothetical protein [Leadbettera azotonutricia]AEF81447.1 hypothetical protein TREAZ_0798 [Leadbettera azotonutricia ZAS-9]